MFSFFDRIKLQERLTSTEFELHSVKRQLQQQLLPLKDDVAENGTGWLHSSVKTVVVANTNTR